MGNYLFFLVQLFVNCILGSALIVALINKLFKNYKIDSVLTFMVGLGMAPAVNSLLLYYLFVLFKGFSPAFYVFVILFFWFLLYIYVKKEFSDLLDYSRQAIKEYTANIKENKLLKYSTYFLILYTIYWLIYVGLNPIADHDFFEYAIQGKIFARERAIYYVAQRYDAGTDFCYVGLHGYSFPLIASLDNIQNELFGFDSDYFFKSITGYYWMLIVLLQVYFLNKINLKLAVFGALTLMMTYGYYLTFYTYHIDTFRIFFMCAALIYLLYFIKSEEFPYLILFGALAGCEAFAHSLGVFLAIFQIGILFLFSGKNILDKIKISVIATLLMLGMGGIHYIIDVLYGTGWIFQEIKFY